jgi:hypothetical protein
VPALVECESESRLPQLHLLLVEQALPGLALVLFELVLSERQRTMVELVQGTIVPAAQPGQK